MGAAELAKYYITPEEYLAGEEISQQKHEYLDGVIYAMAGASEAHNVICANISGALWQQLRNRRCRVLSADYKVRVQPGTGKFFYYPDVLVDCAEYRPTSQFADEPRVIFEVLSQDSDRVDRQEKWFNYQRVPSLDVYVLVDQFRLVVTIYRRTGNGWITEILAESEDVLTLPTVGCSLPLTTIYERTQFLN